MNTSISRCGPHIKELIKKYPFVDSITVDARPDVILYRVSQVTCLYRDYVSSNLIDAAVDNFSLLDLVVAQSNEVLMRAANHR